jgi:hypothetical protein
MITVSIKNLVSAIAEADVFKLPDMNEGTAYLYDGIYNKLSRNMEIRLSDIDYDAFEPEDIDSINRLYTDVFEKNACSAGNIMSTLRQVTPVHKAVAYV